MILSPWAIAGAKTDLRGDIRTGYNDNLFRLSDEQIADFDGERDPGERFFGLEDPKDLVTSARLRWDAEWKRGKKRNIELMLLAAYTLHQKNDISDYPEAAMRLRWQASKRSDVYVRLDGVFDRFWENYRIPSSLLFAPASYDQLDATLGYAREIRKHSSWSLELRHRDRGYAAPLKSRDRTGAYGRLAISYRLAKRIHGQTGLEIGKVDVDPVVDFATLVDRSHDQQLIDQRFRFKLPAKFSLETAIQYRVRDYTTSNSADLARFNREDSRWRTRITAEKSLGKKLDFVARATLTDNDSDRLDPTVEADEVGYEQKTFDLGLRYAFR